MVDLIEMRKKKPVYKAADFYKAVGAAPDSKFDEIADMMEDYCDLDYCLFKIGGKTIETIAIGNVRNKDFPGFSSVHAAHEPAAADEAIDILDAIDDLVGNNDDLYYTREQLKKLTGADDADIDEYLDLYDEEFTEEICVPAGTTGGYHVLTDSSWASLTTATNKCIRIFNGLAADLERASVAGGPPAMANVLNTEGKSAIDDINTVAKAVTDKFPAWPQKLEVI